MNPVAEHLQELASLLKERVGLHIRPDGYGALKLALGARFEQLNGALRDPDGYLALLRSDQGDDELRALLPLVTVGKTSFFRDDRQFAALRALMPQLLRGARARSRPLSIWSAGCATGEEAYSIAITAAEEGAAPADLELLASDVNPEAVSAASRGAFDHRRVREIPPALLARYFDQAAGTLRVRPELRRLLDGVRPHNLASSAFPRPQSGAWDVIFCRNVIIYFDTATTQQVLSRFHEVLAPGGYLFLGYSESLFRIFEGFELAEVAGAFLYRRPHGASRPAAAGPAAAPTRSAAAFPHHALLPVRHVHVAEKRGAPKTPPPAPPQEVLDHAVALFADGRFGAARDLLERLLARGGEDLAVRLTLANLYGILRQPDRARESYLAALAVEPLSAEAHLFYGIHLLSTGEVDAAAQELSRALFVDPDLALGHYYLGRCREAQRDPARARLAYKNAIDAHKRQPAGKRQAFLGYYPDIPEDGGAFARAAEYAIAAL